MEHLCCRGLVAMCLLVPLLTIADSGTTELDTIVVTGTRSERKLLDVPVRTEVVTRSEIEQTHARDLSEALRHQPGLLLKEIHGKNGTEVWLQGLNSDRVLVLIDGRPTSASTGSTVDLSQITTTDIERIEIVKGAVSALYGSAAMGGVVNVITRERSAPLSYELQVDSGSYGGKSLSSSSVFGHRHLSAGVGINSSSLSVSLDLDIRDSDGFDLDDSTFSFEGDRGMKLNVIGDVRFTFANQSELTYSSSWYEEDIDRDFSTFAPGVGDIEKIDAEEAERFNQTLSWSRDFSKGARASAYLLNESFTDTTTQDVILTAGKDQQRHANIDMNKAEFQLDIPAGDSQLWTIGGVVFSANLKQWQNRIENSQTLVIDEIVPGADRQNFEFYLQNDVFIGDRWEFIPGLRLQEDSDFASYIAPKINVLYIPSFAATLNPRIRFGVGRGYRVPNLKERFFTFDHSSLGYVVLGNPDLQPEESDSMQLGFEVSSRDSVRGEVSLFYNKFYNLISTSLDSEQSAQQQLQVFRFDNIESAVTRGVDIGIDNRINDAVSLDVSYTWLDAINLVTDRQLTRRPSHQVGLGIDLALPASRTSLTMKATWQSKEFVDSENTIRSPGYTAIDLKLNQLVSSQLKIFLGVDNLFDEHRNPDRAGRDFRPRQGRFVYTGIRYEL